MARAARLDVSEERPMGCLQAPRAAKLGPRKPCSRFIGCACDKVFAMDAEVTLHYRSEPAGRLKEWNQPTPAWLGGCGVGSFGCAVGQKAKLPLRLATSSPSSQQRSIPCASPCEAARNLIARRRCHVRLLLRACRDFEAHGDFRRNYSKVVGEYHYLRSVSAARGRSWCWAGLVSFGCSVAIGLAGAPWLDANNLVLISLINSSTVLARTAL
jgi:hypothetical protein